MPLQWFLVGVALLLSAFQLCFSADLAYYEACTKRFQCGDVSISYPFWGGARPSYCGIYKLRLDCSELYSITKYTWYEDTYIVLNYTEANQILRVVNNEVYSVYCYSLLPSNYPNPFMDNNSPLQYAPGNQNLTLFYNCSSKPYESAERICSYDIDNTTAKLNTYLSSESEPKKTMRDNSNCQGNTHIPFSPYNVHNEELRTVRPFYDDSELNIVAREGFDVKYAADYHSFCANCTESGGVCGTTKSYDDVFHCYCHDGTSSTKTCHLLGPALRQGTQSDRPPGNSTNMGRSIALAGGSVLGFCILVIILCLSFRSKFSSINSVLIWKRSKKIDRVEEFLRQSGSMAPKRYKYSDIKTMTGSFKVKIGQGGFGGVFKGKLLDGRLVAVKVMRESKGDGENFINEVASISRTSHVNVVSLLGFSFEGPKRALVYEFMSNGSLEKFIYNDKLLEMSSRLPWKKPLEMSTRLPWKKLFDIVVGISRGLEYLHRGCNTRMVHFDIKPHNILLDEEFNPKISDFGLAKLCSTKESYVSMLDARGTAGYIAPEVFCRSIGEVSHKSDVYSYGMMVLEIVGGRKNVDGLAGHTSEIFFPHWIHKRIELNEDLGLHGIFFKTDLEITKKMILVGLWCIQTSPFHRPSMSKVVEMLEGSVESLQVPPKVIQEHNMTVQPLLGTKAHEEDNKKWLFYS